MFAAGFGDPALDPSLNNQEDTKNNKIRPW
ncbi:MAG: hypothetical protein RIS54_164 [Verrucomicrobiota bacterium]|jgi:hypothetical protein